MTIIDGSQHPHTSFLPNKNITTFKFNIFFWYILTISKSYELGAYG